MLATTLGYPSDDLDWLPEATLESFAGTGNPLSLGQLREGMTVLDVGCGAGIDTLLAARQVGPTGRVIAIDMTEAMLAKTRAGAEALALENVDARLGFAEDLPVDDAEIDVVISNGVINLTPDKVATMTEIHRTLRPGGRIQIADIVVHRAVPEDAKSDIDLWSG
jgi:ubiquinone/menaquinone biosynthesis C-methylase UbiE